MLNSTVRMDRTTKDQQEIEDLNIPMNQSDLKDIYRTLHPTKAE